MSVENMEFLISGVCDTRIINWEKIGLDSIHTLLGCTVFIHLYMYVCLYICLFIYTHTHTPTPVFCIAENIIIKLKRQWQTGRMFTTYIMDIALVSQIFNYPLKLRKKRTGNCIERWTKYNEQWDEVRFATSWSLFSPGGRGFVILFCFLLYTFEVSREKFWFK